MSVFPLLLLCLQVTAAVTAFKSDKLSRLAESLAAETLLGAQQPAEDDEPLLEEEKVREAWSMAQNTITEVRPDTNHPLAIGQRPTK